MHLGSQPILSNLPSPYKTDKIHPISPRSSQPFTNFMVGKRSTYQRSVKGRKAWASKLATWTWSRKSQTKHGSASFVGFVGVGVVWLSFTLCIFPGRKSFSMHQDYKKKQYAWLMREYPRYQPPYSVRSLVILGGWNPIKTQKVRVTSCDVCMTKIMSARGLILAKDICIGL